jgi:hypothetical protein
MELPSNKRSYVNSPTVLIVCDSTSLIKDLISELAEKDLSVVVVSKHRSVLSNIYKNNQRVFFMQSSENLQEKFSKINYLIYVNKCNEKDYKNTKSLLKNLKKEIFVYKKLVKKFSPKPAFLLYGMHGGGASEKFLLKLKKYFKEIKSSGMLILYGDLISSSKETCFLSDLYFNLVKGVKNNRIKIHKNTIYYPISTKELSFHATRLLFSMKAYGRSVLVLGRPLIKETLERIVESRLVFLTRKESCRFVLPHDEKIVSRKKSKLVVGEAYKSLKEWAFLKGSDRSGSKAGFVSIKKLLKETAVIRQFSNLFVYHKLKIITFFILIFFLLPLVLISFSMGFLFLSKIFFERNFVYLSTASANTSHFVSSKNHRYLLATEEIPVVGLYFKLFIKPSQILKLQTESSVGGLEIVDAFSEIFRKILFKENLDSEALVQKLVFDLDNFYQKIGFLEGEVSDNESIGVRFVSMPIKNVDLASIRRKTLLIKNFSQNLPKLLGADKPKKYAFIFQNNSSLRPTGGSIEALLIVDFSGSKITGEIFEDASWPDKNLSGKVEPPAVINKYFEMDQWYFRDSNWDPDFPSSASQIEFFLDRGLDLSLEGLIALDKEFLYKFLKILNRKNSAENLDRFFYENNKAQNHLKETDEYPLASLVKSVLGDEYDLDKRKTLQVIKEIYSGLNNRNIQVYAKDVGVSKNLSDLSWDGSFLKYECFEPCFSEFISVIESAHKGDSSAILREAQMSLNFQEGIIKRKLTFYMQNQGRETYKVYLRLFTNPDVGFSPVSLNYGYEDETTDPEIRSARGLKEAGVYFEIEPKQSLVTVFFWEGVGVQDFSKKGEFLLNWRKQAGVDQYPLEVVMTLPYDVDVFSDSLDTLTDKGVFRYNTLLDQDIVLRYFW